MVADLIVCVNCGVRVWPTLDGYCPSCRKNRHAPHTEGLALAGSTPPGDAEICAIPGQTTNERNAKVCRTCRRELDASVSVCLCGVAPNDGHNFCHVCGDPTYFDETECPAWHAALPKHAGVRWIAPPVSPISPAVAVIASMILPGLGQMLLGQGKKGILFLLLCPLWPMAVVDAGLIAAKLAAGKAVREWEVF